MQYDTEASWARHLDKVSKMGRKMSRKMSKMASWKKVAPVPEAVSVAGDAGVPPLVEIVEMLKTQLELSGNIAEVVAAACEALGVSTEGKSLSAQAQECWLILGAGRGVVA